MDLGLEGRVALVTGASQGLGRACALELLSEGASVLLVARDSARLQAAADDLAREAAAPRRRASDRLDPVSADDADIWLGQRQSAGRAPASERVAWLAADVANPEAPARAVAATVERFGRLDLLVVNAGGPPAGPFESIAEDQWDRAVETTFRSGIRLVRAALPYLREERVRRAGGGRIVFITSISVRSPVPNLVTSNALRPGVVGLMKTLSIELAPDGILVNAVAPGRIATERLRELDEDAATRSNRPVTEIEATNRAAIPLGRYGDPRELAAVVAFLCSSRASYVSGAVVGVDGAAARTLL
jgi:3-oxoacyl-[acyl-carrier protein] reductase